MHQKPLNLIRLLTDSPLRKWHSILATQVVLVVRNLPASAGYAGDVGLIPGVGRSPGGGHSNTLQFLPGESHGQRSLVGIVPGASVRNPTHDKVMWQRPDGQGESSLRFSSWHFLSMYPPNKNLPALYFSTLLTHSGKS